MRQSLLTASLLTGLFLGACAENKPKAHDPLLASETPTASARVEAPDTGAVEKPTDPGLATPTAQEENAVLDEQYRDLDPRDISRDEIEELIVLRKDAEKTRKAFQDSFKEWRALDPSMRGEQPVWRAQDCSSESGARKEILESKVQKAHIRKRYKDTPPAALSKNEAEELIILEQEQHEKSLAAQGEMRAWSCKDPATRGPQPNMFKSALIEPNPRLRQLQGKIASVQETEKLKARIAKLSVAHKISMSDDQISELMRLEREKDKVQMVLQKAVMEAAQDSEISGAEMSPTTVMEKVPKHVLKEMVETEVRMQAIRGPLEAAEQADLIRTQLMALSEESGVAILSGEITETIALRAEKDRIENKAVLDAIQNWIDGDGPVFTPNPLPNDEDYARIKEIDARLKVISAPMINAKNAAAEAKNPALKRARLERERQKKWRDDWKDRQQAGEIPQDAILMSPSYFELQDRAENYRTTIKARAKEVGHYLSEIELNRLDELNDEMLDIRKHVHEMELDGSKTLSESFGLELQAFGVAAGMYKIGLIEGRQRELLAELIEAEAIKRRADQNDFNETGSRQFNQSDFGKMSGQYGQTNGIGAEAMIEMFRSNGLEVPQSEADDLLDFEREFKDRK
jgi:hypothetical protein